MMLLRIMSPENRRQKNMDDKKTRFLRIYANLPLTTREEVVYVTEEEEPLTWNSSYIEVKNETRVSKQILEELDRLQII